MLLEENKRKFPRFPSFGNLGKCSFTSDFDGCCNFFKICIFYIESEVLFFGDL